MSVESAGRKRSTLRDVAVRAGVSVATVSRVLNNSALVAPDTKQRVGAAIDALNFAPSAVARSLNAGRTRTIGTLVPTINHSIFSRYLNALEDALSDRGYGLVVAVTRGSTELEARKARDLLDLGVDGLFVSGIDHSPDFNQIVRRFDVPVIVTSYYDPRSAHPTIGYDNAAIARMAMQYLQTNGHTDVAVIHGPLAESDRTRARVQGALSVETMNVQTFECQLSVAGGDEALGRIQEAPFTPSAVFCLSDVQALGALFHAQREGISIPRDLSVMGFDNLEWSASSTPGITTIELPSETMGARAADAMIDQLINGVTAQPLALSASIIERSSVRTI